MTTQKKAGLAGGITLAGVIAVLMAWPHLQPILEWLAPLFASERVQHVAAALVAGLCVGVWMPYVLPSLWPGRRTRSVAYAVGAILTGGLVLWMEPTRTGAFHAFIATLASPTVAMGLSELYYIARPHARPASLQP